MKKIVSVIVAIFMLATMVVSVPLIANATGEPRVTIDGISADEGEEYYKIYVSYTIENWAEEMELAVLAYNVTDIVTGTENITSTPVGFVSQEVAEVDGGVLEFEVKKSDGTEDELIASFAPESVMLVKIGVDGSAISSAKTYVFPEEGVDPSAAQIRLYANSDCSQALTSLSGTAYAKIENTDTTDLSLIAAGYDSSGKIIFFTKVDGSEIAEIDTEGCAYIKAFAWDFSEIVPMLDSVKFPK